MNELLPLSQRNKLVQAKEYFGTRCIYTVADKKYRAFEPLFRFFTSRAYPGYDVIVDDPPTTIYNAGPVGVASSRFLLSTPRDYDYCLITDIDIAIINDGADIIKTEMRNLEVNKTECYNNWLISEKQVPGVHFVTKAWWYRTAESRDREFYELSHADAPVPYFYDEKMLYRIIQNSGIPLPSPRAQIWNHYGQHLGSLRNIKKQRFITFQNTAATLQLLEPEAQEYVKIAAEKFDYLNDVLAYLKREYHK